MIAPIAKLESIRLSLAYASFKHFGFKLCQKIIFKSLYKSSFVK